MAQGSEQSIEVSASISGKPLERSLRPTLREVFDQEVAFVFRVLRRLGVPERDLDDAAQDLFVIVHRKLHEFDESRSLRSWLFGIARRVALARRRRAQERHEVSRSELELTAPAPDEQERHDARRLLQNALDCLDMHKRAVFVLYEIEGMDMKEVAAALGCPLQTAYSRLHAARLLIRGDLERVLQRRTS